MTTEPAPTPPHRWANLRILWSYIRPHRATLAAGMLLGLVVTGSGLATPMVTKHLLDALETGDPLAPAVALLALLLLAGAALGYVQWVVLGTMGERIILDARTHMVRRLLRAAVPRLNGRSSGEFVTRVTSDTVLMREAAASGIVELLNGTIGLIGALALMALLDTVLFATTVLTLLAVALLSGLLMPRIATAQQRAQAAIGRLGATLENALRAIRSIKAGTAEERESERILTQARQAAHHHIRAVRVDALVWTVTMAGVSIAIMLILGLGAYRVSTGALTISALVAFLLYMFQLMGPAMELTGMFSQLQSGIAAAARIREVQAIPTETEERPAAPTSAPAAPPADPATPLIALRGVTARYGPTAPPALDGITLDIPRTGHTALIGPSGAGKTTLVSLMLGFVRPEHGDLLFDGRPADSWPLEQMRARMAYVEQEAPLLPGTLAENLRYTRPDASEEALRRALDTVHLSERIEHLPHGLESEPSADTLSGGERQRIALARALVARPDLLLLDEATAQLDGRTESAIQHAIAAAATRSAVVTIAHRLSTVIDADRIVVVEHGRIRATGTHTELLRGDALYGELIAALRIGGERPAPRPV